MQCEIAGVYIILFSLRNTESCWKIVAEISQVEACICDDPAAKRNAQKIPKPLIDLGRVPEEEAPTY